uniref:Thioredoxin 1/thioredoxin 2 n=1 Tax=Candidatus Kentrum sp. FM TaxID=2126340 RepID=A0A450THH3_9GAMM|nr:MAG: thioredoxin 1/thioredoxin 2 [Candidatus Kentron sp. FM]VFJ66649.1 MAG: thioredoxin 1/thioredoxin 2 [Candidatus Kentron sp. FM]VFK16346.1 MAG: thioredoxin 1/thioredoxin 2 [Candidatus Kentron sp. FM]
MPTVKLTSENFDQTIENSDIVFLDFWASWCGPCQTFGPIFEAASEKYPDVVFGKINTEEERGLAQRFQIRSIPSIMIYREQIPLFLQPGALPETALDDLIGKVKSLDMDDVRRQIAEQEKKGGAA